MNLPASKVNRFTSYDDINWAPVSPRVLFTHSAVSINLIYDRRCQICKANMLYRCTWVGRVRILTLSTYVYWNFAAYVLICVSDWKWASFGCENTKLRWFCKRLFQNITACCARHLPLTNPYVPISKPSYVLRNARNIRLFICKTKLQEQNS